MQFLQDLRSVADGWSRCVECVVRPGMSDAAHKVWDGYDHKDGQSIAGAGRFHINYDFRLNAQPLGACLTPTPTIGGRAWPSFAPTPTNTAAGQWEKALAVWLNTTLGLVARWWVSSRQHQGRANLTITTIGSIPVLDLRKSAPTEVGRLAEAFDRFAAERFLPANEAFRDVTRKAIDRTVLCDVLGLPESILDPLATLRLQWCAEPSVRGSKSTGPPASG